MKLHSWATAVALRFGICNVGSGRTKRKRPLTHTWQVLSDYKRMLLQDDTNTLRCERVDSPTGEEEAPAVEDFAYHRPVLQKEVLELLQPKPGSLMLDGTCGGGGHTEGLLESGADVLDLDQDPDAVQHVSKRLAHFGRRLIVRQGNFRHAASVLDELGIRSIG